MSTYTDHAPGTPNWFELATTDQDGAKRFYAELFGWTVVDFPMEQGGAYSIFRHGERDVGACYPRMPEQAAQGVPPHWSVYFRVEDCDAAVARVRAAGGSVLAEAFEVPPDLLRMAAVADPEGAAFCLFQPREHAGVGVKQELGAVCWVELATRDLARAGAFYRAVFGWTLAEHPNSPAAYRVFSVDGVRHGGLLEMTADWGDLPAHWSIYLQVADVDAALARAVSLGGQICAPPFEAPDVGRIAMMTDPAGAGAYLITLTDPNV